MYDLERARSTEAKARRVIEEYHVIVADLFSSCQDVDAYIRLFSNLFQVYQDVANLKMDPDSIRERKINCASAAALTAIWWTNQFPQLTPIFLVENPAESGSTKTSAHVHVALPSKEPISKMDAMHQYYDATRSRDDITLLDWTPKSYLKHTNPNVMADVFPIAGVFPYVADRIGVLGLPKKYSTKSDKTAGSAA